jgi:ABC-type branched-subunit amino acid transport system substrate-binding protein
MGLERPLSARSFSNRVLTFACVAIVAMSVAACGGGSVFGKRPARPGPTTGPQYPTTPPGQPIPADPAGYLRPANLPPGGEPLRVGLILPLSHPSPDTQAVAKALLDAAQLAVFESGNSSILLMPADTKGTPDGAAQAASLVLSQGAEVVIGPLFAQTVAAAAPVVRSRNIPVVAFSTDRSVAGNGVYLLSFQPEEEVRRVISYAHEQGRNRFAALFPQTAYGNRVQAAFQQAVTEFGGTVAATATYSGNQQVMLEAVKSISTAQADAVLLPEGGTQLRALGPLLPYYNIDPRKVKFMGTGLWDDPSILQEPSVTGGWFAAPEPDARLNFGERFKAAHGYTPPRIASLAYDAVSLINSFANDGPPFQRYTLTTFQDPNGFKGIDGIFRFRPDGTIERGLAVNEVHQSGFKVVGPSPQTFQGVGF